MSLAADASSWEELSRVLAKHWAASSSGPELVWLDRALASARAELGEVLAQVLERTELTPAQFRVLHALCGIDPPSNIADLSAYLGLHRTSIAASIVPLLQRGFVRQDRCERDRRKNSLAITGRGMTRVQQALDSLETRGQSLLPGHSIEDASPVES